MSNPTPATAARRVPRWVWFFLVLGLLAVIAIIIPLWFNLSQQLRPEDVARARAVWEEKRPADYDLDYTLQGLTPERFTVQVRHGRTESVTGPDGPLPPGSCPFTDMDSLFRFVEANLTKDGERGSARTFTVAGFAPEDGHILHYVRSVLRTRERIEIDVKLRRIEPPPR
jgi:hypothetical protein